MIRLENVSRYFGSFAAVDDLSFNLEPGQVTGFLGPNGAGKTTTMRLITGFLAPDQGRVLIDGTDLQGAPASLRGRLGYLPENSPLYGDMTILELLEMAAGLCGKRGSDLKQAIARVVAVCGLGQVLKTPVSFLSKGYVQRVGLAQALIGDPQVLVLDEPTTGLDPNQIRYIKDLITELGQSRTVLLSTHLLYQVPEICDRVLILNKGKLIFDGTPDKLLQEAGPPRHAELVVEGHPENLDDRLKDLPFINSFSSRPLAGGFSQFQLEGHFTDKELTWISDMLRENSLPLARLIPLKPSLDEIFAELTGGNT